MHLTVVNFDQVRLDAETGAPKNFNTSMHSAEEAPDATVPTEAPYSYERWISLIMESRGIPESNLQVVSLSRAQAKVLVTAAEASIHTRVINRSYAEDLQDEVHPAFRSLSFPCEGLFMRLGSCSPKDGAQSHHGRLSLHSISEIILRLTTSQRARNSLTDSLDEGSHEIHIYFLPFDENMRAEREYRVFCMPGSLQITAISQYRWHKKWVFVDRSQNYKEVLVQAIQKGVMSIHKHIMDSLEQDPHEFDHLIPLQGFSFDVLYDEKRQCCILIELNPFGVRSACGSCLFQWITDRAQLYGKTDDVEFRVTF